MVKNTSKRGLLSSIQLRKLEVFFLCGIVLFCTILGVISIKKNLFMEKDVNYYLQLDRDMTKNMIFSQKLKENIMVLLLFWTIGGSIVGIPVLVVYLGYQAFLISVLEIYIIKSFDGFAGYTIILKMLYIPTLFEVIAIFILIDNAINFALQIIKNRKSFKHAFSKYSIKCAITGLLLLASTIYYSLSMEYII